MNRSALLLCLLLTLAAPSRAWSQEPPTLDRVEELSRLGRTQEAREMILAWWEAAGPRPPRREVQRGIWLRGSLALNADQAALDFRRLVIEFPGGAFSHLALFRLAQFAFASGDSASAAEMVAQLGREYPASPVRREAEAWLATAGPVPEPPARDPAPAAPVGEPPVQEAAPAAVPTEVAESATGRYAVQLGAFSSQDRAEALLARVNNAGFEARLVLVAGSDLVRVRVGRFDSAEGAGAILARLQDLGFTAAIARDADREERVR